MKSHDVYQLEGELGRLAAQNHLFREAEGGAYSRILHRHPQACVLDVGCNNGTKLVNRFAYPAIENVVGLEFHANLAERAQANFGDEHYAFYHCDVEAATFGQQLDRIMMERGIEAFDIIHISLVLLHLDCPTAVLNTLRRVLSPQGELLIVEPVDSLMKITPDPQNLCGGFVSAMADDPYAGNRSFVHALPKLLEDCGYEHISTQPQIIFGDTNQGDRKANMFEIICSFLGEDAKLVQGDDPWIRWVEEHFAQFEQLVKAEPTQMTVCFHMITCSPKESFFRLMREEDVEEVMALCNRCVGENLYPEEVLRSAVAHPDHYFYLLQTQRDELVAYLYCKIVDAKSVSDYAKLPADIFQSVAPLPTGRIVQLQTIGVAEGYRNQHYSDLIQDYVLETVQDGDGMFALCWHPPGIEPAMAPYLESRGFLHIADSKDVWAEVPDLICPYCEGVCHCSGAAYYRPLPFHQTESSK